MGGEAHTTERLALLAVRAPSSPASPRRFSMFWWLAENVPFVIIWVAVPHIPQPVGEQGVTV
jgi:hypothetical protein